MMPNRQGPETFTQNSVYSTFLSLPAEAAISVSPAELHGHLLDRVCAGAGFGETARQHAVVKLSDSASGKRLKTTLSDLLGMVRQDLSVGEVTVVMLLPNGETPLARHTEALGQWCQDFLAGLGLTAREGSLTGEAGEMLQDVATITQVQGRLENSEDGETGYMEVMECLRVASLLLFVECGKPLELALKPSLH